MNILILSQWFDPEPNNMKSLIFAKGLEQKGHKVQVLTGIPNYPTGKLYSGYKLRIYQREIMEHILIHRVLLYPSHDSNFIRRCLNYLSFSFFAALVGPWVIQGKVDVIYVYHPPVTAMFPALILRKLKKSKILLDINDLWPDSIYASGMLKKNRTLKLLHTCMNFAYRNADQINVLSPGIKQVLIQRGVKEEIISTIPVWCNESLINSNRNNRFLDRNSLHNRFIGIYAGAMGRAQNLSIMLDAAYELMNALPDFVLVLIGCGICLEELKEQADRKHLSNVLFVPVIPPSELTSFLNTADILLIHLSNDLLFEVAIPSKIAYYLALGKPIAAGLKGLAAEIIEKSGAGILVTPDNSHKLADAITVLYHMDSNELAKMGEQGKRYYLEHMSMDTQITRLSQLMTDMVVTVQPSK